MSDDLKTAPDAGPEKGRKPRMGRGMRILLILSLAFNLLIVGLAVGAVLSGGPKGHRDARMPAHVRALDHEDRRAIGQDIRAAYRAGTFGKRAERQQSERLADLIAAQPFDRVAVGALSDEIEAGKRIRFEVARDIWLDRVEAMSPQARVAYAERLREVLAQKGKDRGKDGGKGGPKRD